MGFETIRHFLILESRHRTALMYSYFRLNFSIMPTFSPLTSWFFSARKELITLNALDICSTPGIKNKSNCRPELVLLMRGYNNPSAEMCNRGPFCKIRTSLRANCKFWHQMVCR